MNDLFNGLIRKDTVKPHTEFFGDWSILNDINITDATLYNIQKQQLQNIVKTNKNYDDINNFILHDSDRADSLQKEVLSEADKAIYVRILQLLNTVFTSSEESVKGYIDKDGNKQYYDKKTKAQLIDEKLEEITKLLAKIDPDGPNSKEMIDRFAIALQKSWSKKANNFYEYVRRKADYAEILAVKALDKNPAWKSIQTGNFVDMAGKQLIEDVLSFSQENLSKPLSSNGPLKLYVGIKNEKGKISQTGQILNINSVEDLFKQIEKINGTYTIQLSNELYDALQQAAILKTQVKSGIDQEIFNKNMERNKITLNDVGFQNSPIWKFYNQETNKKYFKLSRNQKSETLDMLTNYYLSLSMAKTVLAKNDLYFTDSGFSTAAEYMERKQRILKFNPKIRNLDAGMLALKRDYNMVKIANT